MKNALFLVIILALFGCEKDNLNSLEKSEISENSSSRLINPISINKPNWVFNYVDTFDDSNVSDGNNGINHKLNSRQLYGAWAGKTWVRRSGTATNTNISPSYSQVNNSRPLQNPCFSFQHFFNHFFLHFFYIFSIKIELFY